MSFDRLGNAFNSLPLVSVPTVVLDTETTGLRVQSDRIVQVGALRLRNGTIDSENTYDRLINPGIRIPAESSAIHGINDDDVANAPPFCDIVDELKGWFGSSLLVGFAIAFDVAIMRAEHERNGLVWHAPRFLDVRDLVELVASDLPQASIEVAADWLDVKIEGRHTALGDAQATAQIYLRLLPKLAERGFVSLAHAERACLQLGRSAQTAAVGWASNEAAPNVPQEFARIDSYPYRHRVREVMSAPPQLVDSAQMLGYALGFMMDRRISSVFLQTSDQGENLAILTERDVLRAIDRDGSDALDAPADHYASRPLASVGQEEFIYRALVDMSARGVRHLGVHDTGGQMVGALSARDLLRHRANKAISLGDNIAHAANVEELGAIWTDLTLVANGLVQEDVDPRDIAAIISRELCELTGKAAELAEQQLLNNGMGEPPCVYSVLVLGSGGRGESMLAMDQDNAIVYSSDQPGNSSDEWFQKLGMRIADILNSVGVPYCKGGIMASNAAWRKSVPQWQETIRRWIARAQGEDILNADIFFDSRPVYGDLQLGEEIRKTAIKIVRPARNFQRSLASNATQFNSPFGFFRRFSLNNGRLDLKKCGIFPIVATARVLALRYGIESRSTADRLRLAKEHSSEQTQTLDAILEAHRILLGAILRQQLHDLERGLILSNAVRPTALSKHELQQLRWALEQIPNVRNLLGTPLFTDS